MKRLIKNNIYFIGIADYDRTLFDGLIPLPNGTSYNSYYIEGSEKSAIIDTVEEFLCETFEETLEEIENIDYLISLHSEQDHSGCIPMVLEKYKNAKLVVSEKGKDMLLALFPSVDENRVMVVKDGEEISLGDKTLKTVYTPWVHWPETMSMYAKEDKILFSCDFFGSHIAQSDLFTTDECHLIEEAKRYFSELMMPFRKMIQKNVDKVKELDLEMIAPSHGPIQKNTDLIVNKYAEWLSDDTANVVVLLYVSMHGSTKAMADYLRDSLIEKGITVRQVDLNTVDVGRIAMDIIDANTVILGSPTLVTVAHPNASYALSVLNVVKSKARFLGLFGSYGWATRIDKYVPSVIPNVKAEILEPVLCKGYPTEETFKSLEKLAETVLEKHKQTVK